MGEGGIEPSKQSELLKNIKSMDNIGNQQATLEIYLSALHKLSKHPGFSKKKSTVSLVGRLLMSCCHLDEAIRSRNVVLVAFFIFHFTLALAV